MYNIDECIDKLLILDIVNNKYAVIVQNYNLQVAPFGCGKHGYDYVCTLGGQRVQKYTVFKKKWVLEVY